MFTLKKYCLGAALAWASLGLPGCSLAPEFNRPEPPVPAVLTADPARPPGPDWPAVPDWRDFFPEPRLKEYLALALAHNRDLKMAGLRVLEARARYGVEKADRLPGLEAEGQKSVTGGAAMPTRRSYEALIALPAFELDFFGRLKNLSASALEQYLATEEAALTARLALVAEVASAYLDSRLAWERLRLTEANRKSWRSSLAFIEERARSGQARLLDLEQARGMLEFAEANLADRRTEIVRAENALKFLTGYFEDQELPEPLALQNWSPATLPEAVPSTVLLQRPDVLEAEHQLKAALADIGVARAAFFPRLALTGSYGLMSGELGNRFTGSAAAWNFTPSLNLPLFAGGRNRANLDLAETRRETAVIQYEKVIQAAFRETADALLTRESRQRQFEAQRQYLATQRRVRELAVNQYQSGTVSYLEVLEAQRDVFEAEMTLLELRREQLANEINLYLALGGGLETADPPAAPAAAPQGEKL